MKFRPHLPDNCPPEDALVTSGTVYRMVDGDPSAEDFLSFRELKPDKAYPSECVAGGLSVYADAEGIRRLRARIPRFRRMSVATGELNTTHGKMKNTPSRLHESHHTWWLAINIKPWTFFSLVTIEDEA